MTISESFFPLISVILLGFYILMFFLGYRKGIVRALIDLVGTIAAVWLSWTIAPVPLKSPCGNGVSPSMRRWPPPLCCGRWRGHCFEAVRRESPDG